MNIVLEFEYPLMAGFVIVTLALWYVVLRRSFGPVRKNNASKTVLSSAPNSGVDETVLKTKVCPACGVEHVASAQYCRICGIDL